MFRMALVFRESPSRVSVQSPPPGWHALNVTDAVSEICGRLAEAGIVAFEVSGFGDDHWPVDVWCDLAVVVEQLPDALENLQSGRPVEIDFFEQGIERTVSGDVFGEWVTLVCVSGTDWQPSPSQETCNTEQLRLMWVSFLGDFRQAAALVLPSADTHQNLCMDLWSALT